MAKSRRIPADGIITIGICFNYFDPDQRKLLEHVDKRTNASAYVKRLIQRDVDGVVVSTHFQQGSTVSEPEPVIDTSLMAGLL